MFKRDGGVIWWFLLFMFLVLFKIIMCINVYNYECIIVCDCECEWGFDLFGLSGKFVECVMGCFL